MTISPAFQVALIAMLASLPTTSHALDASVAPLVVISNGVSEYTVSLAADASPSERRAADEIASYLGRIGGCVLSVTSPERAQRPVIAVGPGAAAAVDKAIDLGGLGDEGILLRTHGRDLILTGGPGAKRGTLYAVETFLQDVAGVRWWSPTATDVPTSPSLVVPILDRRYVPRFEYRDPFWKLAFDADWAAHNRVNGPYRTFTPAHGGGVSYAGDAAFVHSFYALVPPAEHVVAHPEWFSLIKGKRTAKAAQLCLSNPAVLEVAIERSRAWLREHPDASILSISQNDMPDAARSGRCTCEPCLAIEAEEGSQMGPVLRFVNAVAMRLEKEFPRVAFDTLAYQYTRTPTTKTVPRPNVIIRLCSIENSFSHPLDSETNADFRNDLRGWHRICDRLYVWGYTTSYSHYLLPFPDLRVLGPNIALYADNGVRGVLEQGNHASAGADFAELRGWVLAQLLWDPTRDGDRLVDEFVTGYYREAAPFIRSYIDLVHDRCEASGARAQIDLGPDAPFFTADLVVRSEALLAQARSAVAAQPELLRRVELVGVPIRYVALTRWQFLKRDPAASAWPFPDRAGVIADVERICADHDVIRIEDQGNADANIPLLRLRYGPPRPDTAPRPRGFERIAEGDYIDLQDGEFSVWQRPTNGWKADDQASDGMAAWMPGDHDHWNIYLPLSTVTAPRLTGIWTAFMAVRVDQDEAAGKPAGTAFTCGVHDRGPDAKAVLALSVACADLADDRYHVYRLGAFTPAASHYLWAAPAANARVRSVSIDRIILVRGDHSGVDASEP
ncbi:MAG: DUF4838 domain-containing protein [Planctomycetes bacterium]|nr:DUF4838 domain-containing protein [Planctomycetota bacterium]